MGADEPLEVGDAPVALTASPDRLHVRRDRDQLGEVTVQVAVVVGRIEQASRLQPRSGSARIAKRAKWIRRLRRNSIRGRSTSRARRCPRMSSPIGRSRARRASSSPRRIGASTVSVRGVTGAPPRCRPPHPDARRCFSRSEERTGTCAAQRRVRRPLQRPAAFEPVRQFRVDAAEPGVGRPCGVAAQAAVRRG